uniref:Uncharacterized protein n=1 Tax=Thermosporothrix sp. COM3 TaxID=2490863 RepID=A0A455SFL3_9CHLR|nr:hypothetical protein KTC_19980 [Thermosporothrix sp. COM3]
MGFSRGMKEVEQVGPTIPHMNDAGCVGKRASLSEQAHPPVRFSVLAKAMLAAAFALWGGSTNKRFLRGTPHNSSALGHNRQHRLQEKALPSLIADLPQTTHMKTMTQIDLGGILKQQNH